MTRIIDKPFGMQSMWLIVFFDLPTGTRAQRRAYSLFRRDLLADGFTMTQYSVYRRHCASFENTQVHIKRLQGSLPDEGEVRFLVITDKQFSRIVTHWGRNRQKKETSPGQLLLF
jgi:CRISPR-associated protein Cas2